jgi:glucosyl-dolichyl phosphate glucuronosyltransferase
MSCPCVVSVVLCTFNRESMLGPAIEGLLGQSASAPPFELIVVDNASTDATRQVVERYMAAAGGRLRYAFEATQGLSDARNAGIRAARADVVAFTDDDVRVAPNWVEVIRRTFDAHPDVDCLGGRTLPEWPSTPPAWLTPLHWVGPLALQDYGDAPVIVDARQAVCLAGANFAFRKQVFDRVGPFSPAYPRSEDTELMIRLWLSGGRAMYVPDMLVHAAVQHERLEKGYHRRWHFNIGRCNARMAFAERSDAGGGLRPALPVLKRVLGVPRFALRQFTAECARWLVTLARRDEARAFWHEVQARSIAGYMLESAAIHRRQRTPTTSAAPVPGNVDNGPVRGQASAIERVMKHPG